MSQKGNNPERVIESKGFAPILVVLLIGIMAAAIGGAYYFGYDHDWEKSVNEPTPQTDPVPTSSTTTSDETTNWKTYNTTGINTGLTLKYPPNWVTPEGVFIAEKNFVPGEQDRDQVYNIIEIHKYSTQIYQGSTNNEWFNKINSLTEPMVSQKSKITKIAAGKINSGEPYVIFKDEPSPGAQTDNYNHIVAYISKETTTYQLTLDLYDNNGLEVLKKIIASATLN